MFNPQNTWPVTEASRGTKFFAQAFRAFLDKESFEGFRAYSLDTMARLREAAELVEDVKAKRVKEAALKPVVAELCWSLIEDDVAESLASKQRNNLINLCLKTECPKSTLLFAINSLRNALKQPYKDSLIDKLCSDINQDKRISILRYTGFLTSHLINEGNNRDYLIHAVDEKFFTNQVRRAGAAVVRSFLVGLTESTLR